jgi:Raf kinase inhibitor-like YbhB/YbcL family protein
LYDDRDTTEQTMQRQWKPAARITTLALAFVLSACPSKEKEPTPSARQPGAVTGEVKEMQIKVTSTDFDHEKVMPSKLGCEGNDTAPALSWTGVPEGTKSLALIMDDPDAPDPAAPKMTWVHWVLFNLPPDTKALSAGAKGADLPEGTEVGLNDWKRADYGGPCPPKGRHRYFHKIYALDTKLDLSKPTKAELEKAMKGHILARGELIGTYQKGDP